MSNYSSESTIPLSSFETINQNNRYKLLIGTKCSQFDEFVRKRTSNTDTNPKGGASLQKKIANYLKRVKVKRFQNKYCTSQGTNISRSN